MCKVTSHGHTADKWQKQDLDPGQFDAKEHVLHQLCFAKAFLGNNLSA